MLNITFFVNQSLESPSGVGRYFPIAQNLAKKGHKVNIIALHHNFKSLKEKHISRDGVNVYYVGQMHVLKIGDKKIYFNKLQLIKNVVLSTLKMSLKGINLKSDLIYVFKPQPINGAAAFITKLFKMNRLFVDCDDYEAESNNFSSKIEKLSFILFEDYLPRLANIITVHNYFLIKRYKKLGIDEKKIIYLPNGVDINRFNKMDKKEILKIKDKFNLKNKKIVLYFGSLSIKSGHAIDLLLKSFVIVNKKIKNSILMIVGGGEDIDLLKKYVSDNNIKSVIFTGRVDKDEIPYYIKLSNVTVDPVYDDLPNKFRCPLKILESMAVRVPVVTGDVGDRKLIMENGKTGIIVKPSNYEELANGIIKILKNKRLTNKMHKESNVIIKKYYWDKLVDKLDNYIFRDSTINLG